jgi:recombination protein RecA
MEAISILCRSNAVDLIVLDSTAALVPKAEHDGNMERKSMGEQARLLSQALRKLVGDVGKSNTAVIFINQIRNKVGVMFGNPETTPGGLALKFYSSVRLEIKRMSGKDSMRTDSKDDAIGNRVKVKVVKNKCAVPYKECEFDLYFNKGIDVVSEISDLALRKEIVTVAGNTYSFEKHKWVGRAKFDEAIKEDVKLQEKLKDLILHENIEIRPDKLPVAHKD